MIRLWITDDHPMVITGLQNMLQPYGQISVTGAFSCGLDLIAALKTDKPDVLLLDINLPDINGNELVPVILKAHKSVKILALTSVDTPYFIKDMLRQGCMGYLLKSTDPASLVRAIETVYEGEQYLEGPLKDKLLKSMLKTGKQTGIDTLTRREKEILQLIAQEMSSPEIAKHLSLSIHTIENHRISLMQKLDVKNVVGLAKVAMQMGLA